MNALYDILQFNREFVDNKEYERYQTSKFPDKNLVVLSCMDTRLEELLPKAMNLKNGDFKHVKSAGAIVSHPFGSIMRSILVAIYELNAKEVMVVGHHDCGMGNINSKRILEKVLESGISEETVSVVRKSGINLDWWLRGFDRVEESVKSSVDIIKNHPLMPNTIPIHGLIIDPITGKLDVVIDGYEALNQQHKTISGE